MTFAYVALSVFSLFLIAGHASHGMPMSHCPYMEGQHAMCSMNVFSHITAWQHIVNIVFPAILLLVVIIVAFPQLPLTINPSPPTAITRRPEGQVFLYVELFSQGILNPKIP